MVVPGKSAANGRRNIIGIAMLGTAVPVGLVATGNSVAVTAMLSVMVVALAMSSGDTPVTSAAFSVGFNDLVTLAEVLMDVGCTVMDSVEYTVTVVKTSSVLDTTSVNVELKTLVVKATSVTLAVTLLVSVLVSTDVTQMPTVSVKTIVKVGAAEKVVLISVGVVVNACRVIVVKTVV
jgi:hypothetical protein